MEGGETFRELLDQSRLLPLRPTLREVLQRMSRDGWLEIRHGKATRVRFETSKDGKKVRVAVKSGEKIDG